MPPAPMVMPFDDLGGRGCLVVKQGQGPRLRLGAQFLPHGFDATLELAPRRVGLAFGKTQADEGAVRRLGGGIAGQQAVGQRLAGGAAGRLAGILRAQGFDKRERQLAQPFAVGGDQSLQWVGQGHARKQVAGVERGRGRALGRQSGGSEGLETAQIDHCRRRRQPQAVLLTVQAGAFSQHRRQGLADGGQRLAQARLALACGALRPDPLGQRLAGRAALAGQGQAGQHQGGFAGGQGDRRALRGGDGQPAEQGKGHGARLSAAGIGAFRRRFYADFTLRPWIS